MNWKSFLNGLATAAASGALIGAVGGIADPNHFNPFGGGSWKGAGGLAAGGALVGVLNWLRSGPGASSSPKQ